MRAGRATQAALAAAAAATLGVSGCGGGGAGGSGAYGGSAASPSPTGQATGRAAGAGMPVTATETEFKIALSSLPKSPGTYTFRLRNQGRFPHNLTIRGPGVAMQSSPTLPAGGSGDLTVTLQPGTYELWCSVDSHQAKGMDLKLKIG